MTRPKYVTFRKWAGYRIRGVERVAPSDTNAHLYRAFYLVSQLESPKWGAVQSYDGVGMSGGPLHNIAVYRNGRQGTLWPLLRRIEIDSAGGKCSQLHDLWGALGDVGWYVAQDGRLRHATTGRLVPGREIVREFTGPGGVAPRRGAGAARAKRWITLFHRLFANRYTWDAQRDYAITWLMETQTSLEDDAYRTLLGAPLEDLRLADPQELGLAWDLALCVYHAYSVNAPGQAAKVLRRFLRNHAARDYGEDAPRILIRRFGTSRFGRWKDTSDNRNRYDHTRIAAARSGLWPRSLVTELLPKNL